MNLAVFSKIGSRTSVFSTLGGSSLRPSRLSDDGRAWYARAKTAVAIYDDLRRRIRKIGDPSYRSSAEALYIGNPGDPESLSHRRNSVAFAIGEADSHSPSAYELLDRRYVRERVEDLEERNSKFQSAVREAEAKFGVTSSLGQTASDCPLRMIGVPLAIIAVAIFAAFAFD